MPEERRSREARRVGGTISSLMDTLGKMQDIMMRQLVDHLNSRDASPDLLSLADKLARGHGIPESSWPKEYDLSFPAVSGPEGPIPIPPFPPLAQTPKYKRVPPMSPTSPFYPPEDEIKKWLLCLRWVQHIGVPLRRCRNQTCERFFLDVKNKGKLACSPPCSTVARASAQYAKLKANPRAYRRHLRKMRDLMRERRKADK